MNAEAAHTLSGISTSPQQSTCREIKIPMPWGHIAAKEWGNADGIPVLGVHGWQDNSGSFDTLAPLLPETWRFVAVDLAGHGLSSHLPPGAIYDAFSYALQVRGIIQQLKWEKFSYIGHSMGAGIGLMFSALYPQMVNHVISIDLIKIVSGYSNDKFMKTIVTSLDQHTAYDDENRSQNGKTLHECIKHVMDSVRGSLTYESAAILMKRGCLPVPNNTDQFIYTRDKRIQFNTLPLLGAELLKTLSAKLTGDVLIIKAKGGPWFEQQEVYDEFLDIYKKHCHRFEYVEVEGSHYVHLNNPENVASHIINFIHQSEKSPL